MTDRSVRQQHDRLARVYDQRWSRYISQTLTFLKTWASISPQAAVLDVGCGTGEFERLVLSEHPAQRMVGVDLSVKMLEIAQQKCQAYPNVAFCNASASALPFPDHSFDIVVSASALHYFDQPEVSLGEMRRVLKPGGSVVIMDWCKDFLLCGLFDIALKLIEPACQRCYTQREFHHLLTSAQFDIQSARKVRIGLVWGLMIATAADRSSFHALTRRAWRVPAGEPTG
jgi:ubiquinone/menaquinone biosynthesis C-methylase UbiE